MEIIAKSKNGVIITATNNEVKEILNAVNGGRPEKLEAGMKIPAIDYASTIRKIKTLKADYDFQQLVSYSRKVYNSVQELVNRVEAAGNIE